MTKKWLADEKNGSQALTRLEPVARSSFTRYLTMTILTQNSPTRAKLAAAIEPAVLPSLGILTKYVDKHFREVTHLDSGEVVLLETSHSKKGVSTERPTFDQNAHELEKWLMKKQSRKLLMKIEKRQKRVKVYYSNLDFELVPFFGEVWAPGEKAFKFEDVPNEQKNAPVFRVINCGRDKIQKDVDVEVWKSKKTEKCSFHKVQVCGSVWTCPTCSARINQKRQKEIQSCYDAFATQKESDCMMITLTIKHGFSDELKDTLEKMKEAFRLVQMTSSYKKIVGYNSVKQLNGFKTKKFISSEIAFVGRISATEMTHGRNGWHPHMHQLWFFDRQLTDNEISKLRSDLFKEWQKCCEAVGLAAPLEFYEGKALGIDVRRALSAAQYLAKFGSDRQWGPEKELASSHSKKAKLSGRTPFQILFDSLKGCVKSGALFLDYAYATIGKHQLEFSQKLKKRLNSLGVYDIDKSDDEIASTLEDDASKMGVLNDLEFAALVQLSSSYPVEPFSTVLLICKMSGFDAARAFVRSLPSYQRRT
jgi:hypothetical protein